MSSLGEPRQHSPTLHLTTFSNGYLDPKDSDLKTVLIDWRWLTFRSFCTCRSALFCLQSKGTFLFLSTPVLCRNNQVHWLLWNCSQLSNSLTASLNCFLLLSSKFCNYVEGNLSQTNKKGKGKKETEWKTDLIVILKFLVIIWNLTETKQRQCSY